MGYFDGLVNRSFKKDVNGKTLFFPWGVLAKGRILPNEKTEAKLREFLKFYYVVTLSAILVISYLFGHLWNVLLLPVVSIVFHFGTKAIVADSPYSDEKISVKESYANSAVAHNKLSLWLLFVFSVLFVIIGILMASTAESTKQMIIGLCSSIFFGGCSLVIGYMIKVKPNR